MTEIKTDSPYYKWASEIVAHVRVNKSFTSMRVVELLKANLGDWIDAVEWCDDCEEIHNCDTCEREPQINEGYL